MGAVEGLIPGMDHSLLSEARDERRCVDIIFCIRRHLPRGPLNDRCASARIVPVCSTVHYGLLWFIMVIMFYHGYYSYYDLSLWFIMVIMVIMVYHGYYDLL